MDDSILSAVMDAVRIARDEQIRKVAFLRRRLEDSGHSPDTVTAALQFWAQREAQL